MFRFDANDASKLQRRRRLRNNDFQESVRNNSWVLFGVPDSRGHTHGTPDKTTIKKYTTISTSKSSRPRPRRTAAAAPVSRHHLLLYDHRPSNESRRPPHHHGVEVLLLCLDSCCPGMSYPNVEDADVELKKKYRPAGSLTLDMMIWRFVPIISLLVVVYITTHYYVVALMHSMLQAGDSGSSLNRGVKINGNSDCKSAVLSFF